MTLNITQAVYASVMTKYAARPQLDLSDRSCFERVFSEHERGVYAAAYRVLGNATTAHDVVQDVFMRIWTRPERFDPSRGEIGPFLKLMARSRALDLWREGDAAGRAGDRLKVVVEMEQPVNTDRPDLLAEQAESAAEARAMLSDLPLAQREAIVLAYWAGLTSEEIAAKSGVPVGTAKSRMRLGLSRLRDEYGAQLQAA